MKTLSLMPHTFQTAHAKAAQLAVKFKSPFTVVNVIGTSKWYVTESMHVLPRGHLGINRISA